ncbi:MAG TPA: hypothetical protein VHC21_04820 [Candidatus Saccharimonadales bacterium]|nr:hypothetical protein [Candidatus Saccharimonadales bacterium]
MAQNSKDTIYVDIDDEITGIIDKVRGSSGKLVALVLPKRAGTFQSIVNMKLLKRAADESQKHLVLITSEAGLLPLAGAAGIHVAKTLNSKPEIPMAPKGMEEAAEETITDAGEVPDEATAQTAGDQPVGALAGPPPADNGVETLELPDDEVPEDAPAADAAKKAAAPAAAAAAAKKSKDKAKGGKGFKIPNFGKFRTRLIIGGLILLLIILFIILGLIVLPKATINVKTDATNVPVNTNLNLSTAATSLDEDADTPTLPAKLASDQQTYNQQVPTTGQKNNGSKATGSVTMSAGACSGTAPADVPAGTGVTANGNTYITQEDVSFQPSVHGHQCTWDGQSSTSITAQAGGSSYNTGNGSSFSVAGRSDVSASGSASGGTDNIVQVVNQNDINSAKSKISASNDNAEKQRLQNDLKGENYYAITATFSAGTPNVTQSAQVGAVANSVTVTETITYTMFGVKQNDLKTVIDNNIKNQVDTSKQSILDEGLGNAVFGVSNASTTSAQLTLQATAEVGPQLDTNAIKEQAKGKKPADVKSQLQNNPDVTSVDVKLSPFWVGKVPGKTSKIHVQIAKPTTTSSKNNANNP